VALAGATIIELGVPFTDPMADGPVIQRASERALKHGFGVQEVLDVAAGAMRKIATPIILSLTSIRCCSLGCSVWLLPQSVLDRWRAGYGSYSRRGGRFRERDARQRI